MNLRLLLLLVVGTLVSPARAEVTTVMSGYQYGLTYLPLMVMQEQHLVEAHAKAAGLGALTAEWRVLSGPAAINDGLLSGSLNFGAVGTSSLVTLWAKTRKNLGIRAVGGLSSMPTYLNTNNPTIKSVKDFTKNDRIALPSIKVGVQAVVLQMAAAQAFGPAEFSRLDSLTVGLGHPEAFVALLSGKSEITSHFASAPFATRELRDGHGKIHTVLKSTDVLGGKATFTAIVATDKFRLANPKVYAAYAEAFAAATQWIREHKPAAADLYIKVSATKDSAAEILELLRDPDNEFDLTPHKLTLFANFMLQIGTTKEKATSWKDLAHPNLYSLPGS